MTLPGHFDGSWMQSHANETLTDNIVKIIKIFGLFLDGRCPSSLIGKGLDF
jgi:hypothetical protein